MHRADPGLVVVAMSCQIIDGYRFTGQGAVDKDRLAAGMLHPPAIMAE